jgi:biotin transporter BioY
MYIIAIGWLYVIFMACVTAQNLLLGLFAFLLVGVAPIALWAWLHRRRHQAALNAPTHDESPQ